MKLLILGGTKFVGRHVVDQALAAGHQVTLFHRGQTHPGLFPDAESVLGDRDGQLERLGDREWDAVIDTCGYVPRIVSASAEYLKDRADFYLYVSSISVYADFSQAGITEDAAVGELEDPATEEINPETYGPLKAACEGAARAAFGEACCIVRPGLIVGPHDPTDRFTYWPARFARGGSVLVPGPRERPVQVIDVRDLAAWMLHLVEDRLAGVFNATGEVSPMGDLVDLLDKATGNAATPVWVDEEFLADQGVGPWVELPLWLHGAENSGVMQVDTAKARAVGLTCRPMKATIESTLEWAGMRSRTQELQAGLKPETEQQLLAAWRET